MVVLTDAETDESTSVAAPCTHRQVA